MSSSLPKLTSVTHKFTIPSSNKKISVRPFENSEDKLMQFIKQSNDKTFIYDNLINVLTNCTFGKENIEELTSFDFESLFVFIRCISMGEIVRPALRYASDKEPIGVEINLNDIKLSGDLETKTKDIEVGESEVGTIFIRLKWPTLKLIRNVLSKEDENKTQYMIIHGCIDSIYNDTDAFDIPGFEEFSEWFDTMPISSTKKIKEFFDNIPKLKHTISYKDHDGNDRTYTFEGMASFFTLG